MLDNLISPDYGESLYGQINYGTRAIENYSGINNIKELWTDINNKFEANIVNDLKISKNAQAVVDSIENIFSTEFGARVMRPNFGSNVSRILFEPVNENSATSLADAITTALKQENRIKINNIEITIDRTSAAYMVNMNLFIKDLNLTTEFVRILRKE